MAQLSGIRTTTHELLTYNGTEYKLAEDGIQFGDIVQAVSDRYADVEKGCYYLVNIQIGGYLGFKDDGSDTRGFDDITYSYFEDTAKSKDFLRYRIAPPTLSTAELIAQKRTDLACINAELAELEAKYAEETALKVGDYAKVIAGDFNTTVGTIVRIIDCDTSDLPYKAESLFDAEDIEWFTEGALQRLTPAEAKSALLAQVEALFTEREAK